MKTRLETWADAAEPHRCSPRSFVLLVTAVMVLGSLGVLAGVPQLLQWLLVLTVFPLFLLDLLADDVRKAYGHLVVWAASVAVLGLLWSTSAPDWLERAVPEAEFNAWETDRFLANGRGLLARPNDYTTDHALDYVYVTAGSAFGAGLAPLWMGGKQILVVSHHWGSLIAAGTPRAWPLGIPPWSPLGALGYALLVMGWADVTVAYLKRRAVRWRTLGRRVALATALLALHLSLKLALAGSWRSWLQP